MRCILCDGSGLRPAPGGGVPCPECGGCGVAHCCDGLVACGEIEGDLRFERAMIGYGVSDPLQSTTATNGKRPSDEAPGFKP